MVFQLGGKVLTMSDSSGVVYAPNGIDREQLDYVMELKNKRRGRIKEFADEYGHEYVEGGRPWGFPADLAFPCATQNKLDKTDAEALVKNGCIAVAEGANMPTTIAGIDVFHENKALYSPGKASNAGGVATSGLEMTQNSQRMSWTREK